MTGPFDRDATMAALASALPYIRLHRGRAFVVKLGGSAAADPQALRRVAGQVTVLSELGIRVVLVHGGGPQTTALSGRLGVATRVVEGRRVTSPEALQAAVMAMNGTVRTAILAACRAAGLPAIGLSGVDAALVRARLRPPVVKDLGEGPVTIDFGEVGDIVSVDRSVLERLLAAGFVPLISPLAADDGGRVLNVNSDTVAAAVAAALQAEKLILLTDTPGLLEDPRDPASMISYVDLAGLDALERRGAIGGGMLPKVQAARAALAGGVKRVHIVGVAHRHGLLVEVFTNEGAGTLVVNDIGDLTPAEQGGSAEATGP